MVDRNRTDELAVGGKLILRQDACSPNTLSVGLRRPCSTSVKIPTAVIGLLMLAMRNTWDGLTLVSKSGLATPKPSAYTISPSFAMARERPGMSNFAI